MQEYISKIRKLGHNDTLNKNTFNSIINQLQHNIDLLYRSNATFANNWNISELVYGNLMDYDQAGIKRYVNGGLLDSIEKMLSFNVTVGQIEYKDSTILNNNYWLCWKVPYIDSNENIKLIRTISIPESLKHQNILIGIKFISLTGLSVITKEQFEIYVNDTYCGTGITDVIYIDNNQTCKTIYGVYNLANEETNLEITLVRSYNNNKIPINYTVNIESMFVGLNTLGISPHILNFPSATSKFSTSGNDINNFFDFNNNSVKPIPTFITNSETLGTSGSLTVNITQQGTNIDNNYFLGISGSGNKLGTDYDNLMSTEDFFNKNDFITDRVNIFLSESENYDVFTFNKNNYHVHIDSNVTNLKINSIVIDNISNVIFEVNENVNNTEVTIENIEIKGVSTFKFNSVNNKTILYNKNISIDESSNLIINSAVFSAPVVDSGSISVVNNSSVVVNIKMSDLNNTDSNYGFGCSVAPMYIDSSDVKFNNYNPQMNFHIGRGDLDVALELKDSNFCSSNFSKLTTSSISKKFKGTKKSSFEITGNIQLDGGATAFTDLQLQGYSSFASTVSISGIEQNLSDSVVYSLD
jgi:hypothetical protein